MLSPNTSVYAERAWPADATSVEVTLDTGDDTLANAWGPGMALLSSDRAVAFLVRPNQLCYEVNGHEKALAIFYNPLEEAIEREIRIPLHYAGLADRASVSVAGAPAYSIALDKTETAALKIKIPARGRTWLLFHAVAAE